MKKRIIALAIAALPAMMITSCSKDEPTETPKKEETKKVEVTEKAVVENYATIVLQNYTDALNDAKELKTAIDAFVANPSKESMQKAKEAWLKSRESYGPSEAYRFSDGPIDRNDKGPEGELNSWPLDESVIDYVKGDDNSGIINDKINYPKITKEVLKNTNQVASEESVTTGYHAIEFLLWGQDLTAPAEGKAGMRTYMDYTTKANADRRKEYLSIAADLIIEDLQSLVDQWKKEGSYYNEFMGLNTKKALGQIIGGISELAKSELAGERMNVALESKSQEDEHSCFSDNTNRDIRLNFDGIWNVYFGTYGKIKGASIADLVEQKNTEVAMNVKKAFEDAKMKVYATGERFDIAISEGADSVEGKKVLEAVLALQKLGDQLAVASETINAVKE